MQALQCRFLQCVFRDLVYAIGGYTADYASAYDSCSFSHVGSVLYYWGWASTAQAHTGPRTSFNNCTFYDIATWMNNQNAGTNNRLAIVAAHNCIFSTITTFFYFASGDDEVQFLDMDYNCYHNVTTYLTGITTFAAWQAHTSYDGSSHDQHSFEADPLFTTPGTDFTLQLASPCRHAGAGAGVPYDIDGDDFDPYRPDMGAYSTGVWPGQG
jgi:hypothetical protein